MSTRDSSDPSPHFLQTVLKISFGYPYIWALPALFFAYLLAKIGYRLRFSPLHSFPGPIIAKITDQWILFTDMAGNRCTTIHKLHEKYGPIVQLGPHELSFCSIESIDAIYGAPGECNKAPIYDHLARTGVFNIQDSVAHKERRRLLSHVFAQGNLNDMEPNIREQIRKLMEVVDRHSPNAIDVRQWFRMLSLDVAGGSFLGKPFGGLDSDIPPQYVKDFDTAFLVWTLQGTFPITTWLIKQIPYPKIKWLFDTDDRIYKYGTDALEDYIKRYGRVSKRRDLLTKLIGKKESDPEALPDKEIGVELSNFVFAATDTSSTTLTCLFYELARHPELQEHLRNELKSVASVDGFPMHKDLFGLPFLNAAIKESLRHYPPVPSGLMRITPPEGKAIGDVFVPGKTVVSAHTYSLHHHPKHFTDPHTFDPSRWLKGPTQEMNQLFMSFSKGSRDCIGQAMALFEIRLTVAALVLNYTVHVSEKMKEGDMDVTDHFNYIPKVGKCWLRFEPIKQGW